MSAKGSLPPSFYSCVCSVVFPKQNRLRSYKLLVLFRSVLRKQSLLKDIV